MALLSGRACALKDGFDEQSTNNYLLWTLLLFLLLRLATNCLYTFIRPGEIHIKQDCMHLVIFSAIIYKADNFWELLFSFPYMKAILKTSRHGSTVAQFSHAFGQMVPAHTVMQPTVAQISYAVYQVVPAHTVMLPTVAQINHVVYEGEVWG